MYKINCAWGILTETASILSYMFNFIHLMTLIVLNHTIHSDIYPVRQAMQQ